MLKSRECAILFLLLSYFFLRLPSYFYPSFCLIFEVLVFPTFWHSCAGQPATEIVAACRLLFNCASFWFYCKMSVRRWSQHQPGRHTHVPSVEEWIGPINHLCTHMANESWHHHRRSFIIVGNDGRTTKQTKKHHILNCVHGFLFWTVFFPQAHTAVNHKWWQEMCWCIRTVMLSKTAQGVMGGEEN